MTYWAYVGQKSIIASDVLKTGTKKDSYITIHPKNGNVFISQKLKEEMQIEPGNKMHFVIFDELIFICKSSTQGTRLFKRGKCISTQTLFIRDYFRSKLGAYQKIKCLVKKTKSEFSGNALFQLELPYRYKRTFFMNQFKQIQ